MQFFDEQLLYNCPNGQCKFLLIPGRYALEVPWSKDDIHQNFLFAVGRGTRPTSNGTGKFSFPVSVITVTN